ncbi:hypothetical protein FDP41_012140 [Naegleria fowleri]|uniref:Uncharacterized protein n=1 Tax=Naegleria fowleri TaxID=5763 RepID=A0A6A5BTR0_NAEFO|nr:uncharacterized protein FDP41_012140 [Naegleria fowleri]KAF0981483.1 hypothetical protein FDP41_012140 [Naegleria fowleri]
MSSSLKEANISQAMELVKKADTIMTKFIYFGDRVEDATDAYKTAANKFKIGKAWKEAGDTYKKVVPLLVKAGSKYEAATVLIDAANCYKQANLPKETADTMNEAIQLFMETGKFATVAKYEKEMAEVYENEGDYEKACSHYSSAADYFLSEDQKSSANQCIVKLAHLQAANEKYAEAIENFEKAASAAVDDRMLKWGAKEYEFKALMCYMAKMEDTEPEDITEVRNKLNEYKEMDVHFGDSLECKLIEKLLDACEEKNVKTFTITLRDFDKIQKLDTWKTNLFLKIKDKIKEVDLT